MTRVYKNRAVCEFAGKARLLTVFRSHLPEVPAPRSNSRPRFVGNRCPVICLVSSVVPGAQGSRHSPACWVDLLGGHRGPLVTGQALRRVTLRCWVPPGLYRQQVSAHLPSERPEALGQGGARSPGGSSMAAPKPQASPPGRVDRGAEGLVPRRPAAPGAGCTALSVTPAPSTRLCADGLAGSERLSRPEGLGAAGGRCSG